jgi:hypothetical protein
MAVYYRTREGFSTSKRIDNLISAVPEIRAGRAFIQIKPASCRRHFGICARPMRISEHTYAF